MTAGTEVRFAFPIGYLVLPACFVFAAISIGAVTHWLVGLVVLLGGLFLLGWKERQFGGTWFPRSYRDGMLSVRSLFGRGAVVDLARVRAAGNAGAQGPATYNALNRRIYMEQLILVTEHGRHIAANATKQWTDAGLPDRPWLRDGSARAIALEMSPTRSDEILRVLAPDLLAHADMTEWLRDRLTRLLRLPPP